MIRFILASAFVFSFQFSGLAQPQAYDTKVDYQKTRQGAAAIDLPYSRDVVETAISNYMALKGLKGTSLHGFTVYRNAKLDENVSELNDLHFLAERKNHEKGVSVLYLIVANPSEDPASRLPGDVPLDKARTFLNNLVPYVEASNLEAQIKQQEEVVKKALKKKNGLADEQTSLEKRIRNLQSDLEQNKNDQMKQSQVVQSDINGDPDVLKKAQKKMTRLIDDQGSIQKKIRNDQADLDQNRKDQETQQQELEKEQQTLDSMKARRKS